ncbi:hypothetical protein K2X40_01850 [Candidatus Babeliales bacterium]|nr:hypothetical protein [Candidatus Babeliales bacterium]
MNKLSKITLMALVMGTFSGAAYSAADNSRKRGDRPEEQEIIETETGTKKQRVVVRRVAVPAGIVEELLATARSGLTNVDYSAVNQEPAALPESSSSSSTQTIDLGHYMRLTYPTQSDIEFICNEFVARASLTETLEQCRQEFQALKERTTDRALAAAHQEGTLEKTVSELQSEYEVFSREIENYRRSLVIVIRQALCTYLGYYPATQDPDNKFTPTNPPTQPWLNVRVLLETKLCLVDHTDPANPKNPLAIKNRLNNWQDPHKLQDNLRRAYPKPDCIIQ